mmetsp:Transcript_2822/g.7000  ORF Transcript_2822/g.7000 Transcript_2822/m.7000 type:complete len:305 (-) Transcript_2822:674-1588(-)
MRTQRLMARPLCHTPALPRLADTTATFVCPGGRAFSPRPGSQHPRRGDRRQVPQHLGAAGRRDGPFQPDAQSSHSRVDERGPAESSRGRRAVLLGGGLIGAQAAAPPSTIRPPGIHRRRSRHALPHRSSCANCTLTRDGNPGGWHDLLASSKDQSLATLGPATTYRRLFRRLINTGEWGLAALAHRSDDLIAAACRCPYRLDEGHSSRRGRPCGPPDCHHRAGSDRAAHATVGAAGRAAGAAVDAGHVAGDQQERWLLGAAGQPLPAPGRGARGAGAAGKHRRVHPQLCDIGGAHVGRAAGRGR